LTEPIVIGRAERLRRLIGQPFAHRGLHGLRNDGKWLVENSLAAFEEAVAAGHGIELDVQETADGTALVFHDDALDRLTCQQGMVRLMTMVDLGAVELAGAGQMLQPLDAVLRHIGETVHVLVEIKSRERSPERLCQSVLDAIAGCETRIAIMSFNPEVGHWFALNAPEVLRGLIVSEADEMTLTSRIAGKIKRLFSLARSKPDFLAYDIASLPSPLPARLRSAGIPVLTWTVRTKEDLARAKANADQIIHELPRPLWP